MEPAVDPISAAPAALEVARMPGCDGLPPRGEDICAVIRMKAVGGPPTFQFLKRRTGIFHDLAVDEFEDTGRCPQSDVGRKAIEDQLKTTLARTLGFLNPPSVFDIGVYSAPFDDLSGCIG